MAKTIQVSGTRKKAVARATLITPGKGVVTVNGSPITQYSAHLATLKAMEPLTIAGDAAKKVDIKVRVHGGGVNGQAEAVRLVLGKALAEHNSGLREDFLDYDRTLLVADVRLKEPRKPNTHGKARSKRQKSYR
ncbi:MAG: 30S ribosomal protein S9 [Candidatus Woesearchaeota archaeon]